jgi:hypothetical protein
MRRAPGEERKTRGPVGPLGSRARESLPRAPQRLDQVTGALSSGCARVFRDQMSQATSRLARLCRYGRVTAPPGTPDFATPRRPPVDVPANRDASEVPDPDGSPRWPRPPRRRVRFRRMPQPFLASKVRSERARGGLSSGRHRHGRRPRPIFRPLRSPARNDAARAPIEVGPDFGSIRRRSLTDALCSSGGAGELSGSGRTTVAIPWLCGQPVSCLGQPAT